MRPGYLDRSRCLSNMSKRSLKQWIIIQSILVLFRCHLRILFCQHITQTISSRALSFQIRLDRTFMEPLRFHPITRGILAHIRMTGSEHRRHPPTFLILLACVLGSIETFLFPNTSVERTFSGLGSQDACILAVVLLDSLAY